MIAAAAVAPAAPAPACGCGAMIPSDPEARAGQRVDEWSIVRFDGRRETIAMRLESSTAFDRAALVMPVPARATFALGDEGEFDRIAARTRPRVEAKDRYRLFAAGGGDDDGGGGGPRAASETAVDVVAAQELGPLRIVTLRGDDARVVASWLADHRFPVPRGIEPIAQEYLDRGWLLVAARLRARAGGALRRLQPLVIGFPSREVVYPLRMSELAAGPARARVDVVAPQPLAVRGWPAADVEDPGEATRGGRLYGGPLPGGRYLSSFRFAIDRDGFEDPRFVATARRDFRQVRYVFDDVALWPYALGALAVLAAAGLAARRALRRRRTELP